MAALRQLTVSPLARLMLLLCVGFLLMPLQASAEEGAAEERIRERLAQLVPGVTVRAVSATEVSGFYEVKTDQDTIYVSGDGQHVLLGEILRLDPEEGVVNLTEQSRSVARKEAIDALSPEEMVSFVPDGEVKGQMYVFTDVDCGYCRRLHSAMDDYHKLGIQVNYLAFPRAGPGSESARKLVSVWCADDPQAAMNKAKSGGTPERRSCDNPVAEQFRLGQALGVSGTPATVLSDGRMVPGFRPASDMAKVMGIE
ncbi:MAG: DsbC family protein [Oleiphilaceae bacterium]|nr:DsbC family protein [Oleiphilaceae bacterium]